MLLLLLLAMSDPNAAQNAEWLFNQFEKLLYLVAYNQVHNKEDAEDAIMEAFLVLYKEGKLPDANDPKAAGMLAGVVKRKAIDIYRKKMRHETDYSIDEIENNGIQLQAKTEDPGDALSLKDAIKQLPKDLQDVLVLNYYHGLTTKEIARMQNAKLDTVQKRLKRAKTMLNDMLTERI